MRQIKPHGGQYDHYYQQVMALWSATNTCIIFVHCVFCTWVSIKMWCRTIIFLLFFFLPLTNLQFWTSKNSQLAFANRGISLIFSSCVHSSLSAVFSSMFQGREVFWYSHSSWGNCVRFPHQPWLFKLVIFMTGTCLQRCYHWSFSTP